MFLGFKLSLGPFFISGKDGFLSPNIIMSFPSGFQTFESRHIILSKDEKNQDWKINGEMGEIEQETERKKRRKRDTCKSQLKQQYLSVKLRS